MILEALTNTYFEIIAANLSDGSRLAIHLLDETKGLLRNHKKLRIVVLYYLRQRVVNFDKAASEVYAHYERVNADYRIKIDAKWLIIGSGAGIYLFDELRKIRKSKGITHHICTIDTDNGKTFFDPGTAKNDKLSMLFEELFLRANSYSKDEFALKFIDILEKLIPILDQ